MVLIVQGENKTATQLMRHMLQYARICDGHNDLDHTTIVESPELQISNKYYEAIVKVLHKNHTEAKLSESESDIIEGYVLIPSTSLSTLDSQHYTLAQEVSDSNVGLKLLVVIRAQTAAELDPQLSLHYQSWALDNGFEYIEIDTANLRESHDQREKSGLPRLMEALESTMWSTMVKKSHRAASVVPVAPSAAATPSSSSVATKATPAASSDVSQIAVDSSIKDDNSPPATVFNGLLPTTVGSGSGLNIEDEEDDDDMDMAQFANMIAQAKSFREKALSGTLSDAERRSQAAAIAMQMSQLMMGGDDDDEEVDSD